MSAFSDAFLGKTPRGSELVSTKTASDKEKEENIYGQRNLLQELLLVLKREALENLPERQNTLVILQAEEGPPYDKQKNFILFSAI